MSRSTRAVARSLGATLIASGLVASLGPITGAHAASAPAAAPSPGPAGVPAPDTPALADGATTVTLLTGDVLHVSVTRAGELALGTEADGGLQTSQVGDDLYVIPDSAQPYLAAGTVDQRLFNLSELLEFEYDDESTDALPLIVQRGRARTATAPLPGADVSARLESISADAVSRDSDEAEEFWTALTTTGAARVAPAPGSLGAGVVKVWLDGQAEASLDESVPQVHAPEAWAAGFDGTGSTVAVLDTGIDTDHPDLAGQIDEAVSFVPGEDVADVHGHGTHVASTVAGTGAASNGAFKGVAPGARLKIGKVLSNQGFGQDSWIIEGMEWGAANADVVSMSLGDPAYTDGQDPMSQALNNISTRTGTLFVVAAGNSYSSGTVSSPGAADEALTIGAVDANDRRAAFSSWGPRTGDAAIKPDLSAPGAGIMAARSHLSFGSGFYRSMSGTSMATPHVAGAAAIVAAAHPDWSGAQLKAALVASADASPSPTYEVGTGRLDVVKALDGVDVTGSGFLGFYDWPHDGDAPARSTLTYTNDTDAEVRLALSVEVAGPNGPADVADLSADQVTIPAHGSAQVTLSADADDVAATGSYQGAVVGTAADGTTVRTAVALVKEDERYDLDITAKGRDGKPVAGTVTFYEYGTTNLRSLPIDPETGKVATQRLAPGTYAVTSYLQVQGEESVAESRGVALVGDPRLVIDDRDVAIELDASKAHQIDLRTPRGSETAYRRLQYFNDLGTGTSFSTFAASYVASPAIDTMYAAPTTQADSGRYDFGVRWHNTEPLLTMRAHNPGVVKADLDWLYQNGSTHLDGELALPVVWAGTGTPADFEGLDADGKAVVVTRTAAVGPAERAAAAQAAGAALLVVVNDAPTRLSEFAGGTSLPVVSLTSDEGAALAAAGAGGRQVTLRGEAIEFPTYTYDVSRSYPGRIPTGLKVALEPEDLATGETTFHDTSERVAFAGRYDCRDYQFPPCIGFLEPVGTGVTRTEYVSTYDDVNWYADVFHADGWEQRGPNPTSYGPGTTMERHWFAPVTAPGIGDGYIAPRQSGRFFTLNVPYAGGGAGVTGGSKTGTSVQSRLYSGETLLRTVNSQQLVFSVPQATGPQSYRFEQDTNHDGSVFRYSTRTRSAWTFMADPSRPVGLADLPFLVLDRQVDTAIDGTVPAGERVHIGLAPGFRNGVVGAGNVGVPTLEVSLDDGATWQSVPVTQIDEGRWAAEFLAPATAGFVSLRTAVADDAGNAFTQEVIRAFGVR